VAVSAPGGAAARSTQRPALPTAGRDATLLPVAGTEENKAAVRRLIDEVINAGRLEVAGELFSPELAEAVTAWTAPFRTSFPDVHMDVVTLVAEDDEVAGRFHCSATHLGEWRGHPPTGRRFEDVDEVYFFRFRDGRIADAWGLEDSGARRRQLGLGLTTLRG
jgi:predicted ester cyclase